MNEDDRAHMIEALSKGIRFDGRRLDEFRPIEVKEDFILTAEGSASVKIGETEVIAGIKMAIDKPYPDTPDEGTMIVGAELLPLSNPDFEAGPPGVQSIELARIVDRGIRESKALDFKKLIIEPGLKSWLVNADIVSINDTGNLIDASGLAVLLAMRNAKLPGLKEGAIDYKNKTKHGLHLTKLPIPITVVKIGTYYLVDPTSEEEEAMDARLTVTTTEDGKLCALQKGGDAEVSVKDIEAMVDLASRKSKDLRAFALKE